MIYNNYIVLLSENNMKNIFVIILLQSVIINSQNFKYSFKSNLNAFQEIDDKGNVVKFSLWKSVDTEVIITEKECLIYENGAIEKFQILKSQLKRNKLTKIEIKAIKNQISYEIELALIGKEEFFFLVKSNKKIKVYKLNKLLNK